MRDLGSAPVPEPDELDHVRGSAQAPLVIEYADFECPFCAALSARLARRAVRRVFRHFPIKSAHPRAWPTACAAEAAGLQGRFWEMHDLLFANQRQLDRPSLEGYAKQLGLDEARFKAALDSGKFDGQLTADMSEGMRVGAGGTPTFFINGRPLVGALPIDQFRRIIDDELKKAGVAAR